MSTSSRDNLEQALAKIADPNGEGARTCLTVYAEAARAAADQSDARRKAGAAFGPLDGVIVTVKDLFDVAGEVTRAGSKVLAKRGKPATSDAPVVKRLRDAGAVIVAKTNMTEFAYSGVGANPHFGTPGNPADRRRIPGGSSSGAAIAAADGMCRISIGTDTGGSTRIPAAMCGIVGFKPTAERIPTTGAFPLSFSLDSIGPLATSVADCALADAVMAATAPEPLAPASLSAVRLGLVKGLALENLDNTVGPAFERALAKLGAAKRSDVTLAPLAMLAEVNAKGGIAPPEAHAIHRDLLAADAAGLDPNVRLRLQRAADITAADYILNMRKRIAAIAAMDSVFDNYDALVLPTAPIVAPTMSEVADPDDFARRNMLLLRNTAIANFFDLCAISLPIRLGNTLPCGLMLFGRHGADRKLFQLAAAVEQAIAA
jgi:aspartyl-tRNA(Asn)/glutamyl-tRNA(Gln) amidotransferase subunit A